MYSLGLFYVRIFCIDLGIWTIKTHILRLLYVRVLVCVDLDIWAIKTCILRLHCHSGGLGAGGAPESSESGQTRPDSARAGQSD